MRSATKKLCTSSVSRVASAESECEASSTEPAERVVSPIAPFTVAMLSASVLVPCAARLALREISCVAAPCSSTALAMAVVTFSISCIDAATWRTASTALLVEVWMPATCWAISSVAFAVWFASDFTSCATTAKPLPASPARAASIVALSASRLVCAAIAWIRSTTAPMRCAAVASPSISAAEASVVAPASRTTPVACAT